MTPDECDDFKKEILREIETHKINIYEFPDHDDEEENRFVPSWPTHGGSPTRGQRTLTDQKSS